MSENETKVFQMTLEADYQKYLDTHGHNWSSEKLPIYNDKANYNTNSPSYYDYLARMLNYMLGVLEDNVNRVLRRDLLIKDTKSIDLTKIGSWLDNGNCPPNNFDDKITLQADVIISKATETLTLQYLKLKTYVLKNATKIKDDGVWSPDYVDVLKQIDKEINDINNSITEINKRIDDLEEIINNQGDQITNLIKKYDRALQELINNLFNSGAITSNDINDFTFNANRSIATGNINLFGGSADGASFIKTTKTANENDLTGGI